MTQWESTIIGFDVGTTCTDLGNAERLVAKFGSILRYSYQRKRWLHWIGTRWLWDFKGYVTFLAKEVVKSIYSEAEDAQDKDSRFELAKWAMTSENEQRINAMINLTQSEFSIPIMDTELNSNPVLFNCLNGTINLCTGELQSHNPADYCTVCVPIAYEKNTTCPQWMKFLDFVTGGDKELQDYLQRAVGYSLTGDTKSQVLFFLYGLGNNGKSTFTSTIRKLMGEYGERVNTDLFMIRDKNASGPKEALANLKGKRFVVASELEDGRRLAVSLIKDMTGGETIKADRKYEHEIEYQPTHKVWLVGNHKPVVGDTTLSIWRRMKLIPFDVTIPDNQLDPDLPTKLETELPGILAWAVRGYLKWLKYGFKEPGVVISATASYRHEQDILGDFIDDYCKLEPAARLSKVELYKGYENWCNESGDHPIKQRTFNNRIREKGAVDTRLTGGTKAWLGIRLLTSDEKIAKSEGSDHSDQTKGISKKSYHEGDIGKTLENGTNSVTLAIDSDRIGSLFSEKYSQNTSALLEYPHET